MITVWFWLSSIFFLLGICVLVGIGIAGLRILKIITELKPKIDTLESNVQGLVIKLHGVADRVEELTASVKATVDNVGGHARGVAGSAELVARVAGNQFERFSPWLVGTVTAMRLIGEWRSSRAQRRREETEGTPKKPASFTRSLVRALLNLTSR
jgi:hypothetical protein